MKQNKILIYFILAGTVCFMQGCSDSNAKKSLNDTVVNVEVEEVINITGSKTFAYSGTIEESESIQLSFSSVGTVARVLVSEGEYIKKGQLLAELNNESYQNACEMSSATLKQAEDAYKRLEPMYKNGNLPEIKFVEVQTALQQAKAAAAISKKSLDDCSLYSPVDGVVGKRSIDPGMAAIPNLTSITIVKIEKVFARVPVSENEIAMIKIGDEAKIKIGALNYTGYTGTVEEIGVLADPLAHTYKIKIGITNTDRQIKPGMICNVTLNKLSENSGLSVPNQAVLVDEQKRNFVFVVHDNKAIKKYVKTGNLLKSGIEVTEGLNSGELIIVSGMQKLVDNSSVHVVNQ